MSKKKNMMYNATAAAKLKCIFYLLTIPMNKRISTHQEASRYKGVITLKRQLRTEQ